MARAALPSRESYGLEHVRRVLRNEARQPYRAPRDREKCAKVHGPGCRACRTCHFCRRACLPARSPLWYTPQARHAIERGLTGTPGTPSCLLRHHGVCHDVQGGCSSTKASLSDLLKSCLCRHKWSDEVVTLCTCSDLLGLRV